MFSNKDAVRQQPVILRFGNKRNVIVVPAGIYDALRLIERGQPISLKEIREVTGYCESKLANVTDTLYKNKLVDRRTQKGGKTYYYEVCGEVIRYDNTLSFTANIDKHAISTSHRLNVLRLSGDRFVTVDATYFKILEFIKLYPGMFSKPYKTRQEGRALSRPNKFTNILIESGLVKRDIRGNLMLSESYRIQHSAVIITSSIRNHHEEIQ